MVDKIYKFSQSTKETILKAQTGDEKAIAQVIDENMGLITKELTKWRYVPGSDDFNDVLSEIKVEMLQKIIPQWDPKRGAFSTFLTWAIYNFLRRGTRKKQYEEKQKEISTAEPIEEELTLEDTLEQPSSVLDHATLSNARENLQNWIHLKNPELENIVLRIFDLKTDDYSHDQIAEILNSEELSKGKPISRFMVNNYVNDWIKPFIQQYLSSFKTASLSMRNSIQKIAQENIPLSSLPNYMYSGKLAKQIFKEIKNNYKISFEELESIFLEDVIPFVLEEAKEWEHQKITETSFGHLLAVTKAALGLKGFKEKTLKEEIPSSVEVPLKEKIPSSVEVPYSDLLNKYSQDEIWDIASGKKKDVTPEEIEMAKEVISRGIVASKLNMRKKAVLNIEGTKYTTDDVNKYLQEKYGFTLSEYSKRMNHLTKNIVENIREGASFEGAIDSWCAVTDNGNPDFRYT